MPPHDGSAEWGLGGPGRRPLRRLPIVVSGEAALLREQAGVERHADKTPFLLCEVVSGDKQILRH